MNLSAYTFLTSGEVLYSHPYRLRARNELVGLRRPSAQIDHSRAPLTLK